MEATVTASSAIQMSIFYILSIYLIFRSARRKQWIWFVLLAGSLAFTVYSIFYLDPKYYFPIAGYLMFGYLLYYLILSDRKLKKKG